MFSQEPKTSKKPLILAVLSTLGTTQTRLFPAIWYFCQYLSYFLLLTPYFNPVFFSVTGTVAQATAQWEAKPRQTTLPSRFVNFPKIYPSLSIWSGRWRSVASVISKFFALRIFCCKLSDRHFPYFYSTQIHSHFWEFFLFPKRI